jgi:hypothetical protein
MSERGKKMKWRVFALLAGAGCGNLSDSQIQEDQTIKKTTFLSVDIRNWIVDKRETFLTAPGYRTIEHALLKNHSWFSFSPLQKLFMFSPQLHHSKWIAIWDEDNPIEDVSLKVLNNPNLSVSTGPKDFLIVAAHSKGAWDLYEFFPTKKTVRVLFEKKVIHDGVSFEQMNVQFVRDIVAFLSFDSNKPSNNKVTRKISIYDLERSNWLDLGQIQQTHNGENRDRTALFEYRDRDNYYYINDSFLHRYNQFENTWQPWSENQHSTRYVTTYNGDLFRSRADVESQIEKIERYQFDQNKWTLMFEGDGYAHELKAWPHFDNSFVGVHGRFSTYVIQGDRKYLFPPIWQDLSWKNSEKQKETRLKNCHIDKNFLGCSISFPKTQDGFTHQLKKIDLNLQDMPFVSRQLSLSTARYLSLNSSDHVVGLENWQSQYILITNESSERSKLVFLTPQGDIQKEIYLDEVGEIFDYDLWGDQLVLGSKNGLFQGNLQTMNWLKLFESGDSIKRVSLRADGKLAFLAHQTVFLLSSSGELISEINFPDDVLTDLVISSSREQVSLVGFKKTHLSSGVPIKTAFLRTFDFRGQSLWSRFDFQGSELENLSAHTKLYALEENLQGQLVVLGESLGSKSIFLYDGIEKEGTVRLTSFDRWSEIDQNLSRLAYLGVFDGQTGEFLSGQLTSAQSSKQTESSINIQKSQLHLKDHFIALSTETSCCLAHRNALEINQEPLAPYRKKETAFFLTNLSLQGRLAWHPFSVGETSLNMMIQGISLTDQKFALIGKIDEGQAYVLNHPQKKAEKPAFYFAIGDIPASVQTQN